MDKRDAKTKTGAEPSEGGGIMDTPTHTQYSEIKYWLALLRAPGIGCSRFMTLLSQFSAPREVFIAAKSHSSRHFTARNNHLSDETLAYLRDPHWDIIENDLQWLSLENNGVMTIQDPSYPKLLREIHDPPPLLFYRGNPDLLNHPQIAIVGSRNPSSDGAETAFEFAKHLSNAGFAITSGLALGIDAATHHGALAARKLTVAVAGTGLDRVYPARNRDLAHEIARHGVLVSEFAPGTAPLAANFPRRNRIISGLSVGSLVVEAAKQSGSLITARLAMEQSREVFAIPGSIHNPLAKGCHALIRQGAKLVETAGDIMEELIPLMRLMNNNLFCESPDHRPIPSTISGGIGNDAKNQEVIQFLPTADHQLLYAQIGYEPTSIDTLVERSRLTTEMVSAMLVELELKGCVTSNSGMYTRTH